jgi:hypothetical protein
MASVSSPLFCFWLAGSLCRNCGVVNGSGAIRSDQSQCPSWCCGGQQQLGFDMVGSWPPVGHQKPTPRQSQGLPTNTRVDTTWFVGSGGRWMGRGPGIGHAELARGQEEILIEVLGSVWMPGQEDAVNNSRSRRRKATNEAEEASIFSKNETRGWADRCHFIPSIDCFC